MSRDGNVVDEKKGTSALAPGQRWSVARKREVVMRLLRGEALDQVSRELGVEARRIVERFVTHYNGERLHSALGYVTPDDVLADRQREIWARRDRKLEAARVLRAERRAAAREEAKVA